MVYIAIGQLWTPDLGNGSFKNPIIFADYSDPDVVRDGDDYYMVASSFNCMPGIPVLHSKDMVNWEIVNHVYQSLPLEKYDKPAHGEGCWAPSIRFHNNTFYVYFCTPYEGLWVATTKDPLKEWDLTHIVEVEYWEDPCPLWDEDGNAYLVRGKLCGDDLILHKMSADGKKLLDNGTVIYRDKDLDPIIEGPKFMKKDGYYYILAPAGGVGTGWQTVLRSKNIYGPYERKNVLHKGNTNINGPHQGGLVNTKTGEWWFAHFQELKPTGRIVHLNPVQWVDGWPLMGKDINNDGVGEPVMEYKMPNVGEKYPIKNPQTTDEFNTEKLGLQWQWHANPKEKWFSLSRSKEKLRLNAIQSLTQEGNFWHVPNLLLQKFPAPEFTATTKVEFNGDLSGEQCGLVIMGRKWAYLAIVKDENTLKIAMFTGENQKCEKKTIEIEGIPIDTEIAYLRVKVDANQVCRFEYSLDNTDYIAIGSDFTASPGQWIGAKVGLFCINPNMAESKAYADFDWFRVRANK
jgi:beta-xylosidase